MRTKMITILLVLLVGMATQAQDWEMSVESSRGKTVYFNAWGGSKEINSYIRWAAVEIEKQYGVRLEHVKVEDISDTVTRILAEKTAGKNSGGSVDMMWINGENFKAMKEASLLYGPFTGMLPNFALVNTDKLQINEDFTVPVEGLEAPWGVGQLNFPYDRERMQRPPTNAVELLAYAKEHPGRVGYPRPPQFHGSSFLKQVLLDLAVDSAPLYRPANGEDFEVVTAPLWKWLDQFHPVAWRKGRAFPTSSSHMTQLLDDGELDMAISFNPQDVKTAIKNGNLPESAGTFVLEIGALTNSHFLAIPYNSDSKDAAMVVINFFMSPRAQGRKADTDHWGDPTVLDLNKLTPSDRDYFVGEPVLFKSVGEPHPSWMVAIEKAWQEKYGH